jgi:diaminopimelate epimerase
MHGARNDFVVVDRRADGAVDLVEFARWACDRRAGVGADGVITLEPSTIADVGMRIINADGSEAEMCGNGVRCAARWLDETHASDTIVFDTIAGRVTTQIVERGPQYLVRVAIGVPQVSALAMNGQIAAWFVNMGNPHVVVFCDDPANIDLEKLAQEVQRQPRFANGTNVHLVAVQSDGTLRARHWERGVGLTQACGTGAVACAAVAISRGLAASPAVVFVPGGRLVVEWDGSNEASLIGPAARVFDADIDVSFLR